MKQILKLLVFGFLVLGLVQCESDDRFYRPRVQQKLSVIAIIDADDTSRYIIFEKTFQADYPEDLTDSLRDLSFSISDSRGVIHKFQSDVPLENKFKYRIPDSIEFLSGEKYFFSAKEKDCPLITSSTIVPNSPPELKVTTIKIEEVHPSHLFNYIHGISFENLSENLFYSLIAEFHTDFYHTFKKFKEPLYSINFDLIESDTHGFFAEFPGLSNRYTQSSEIEEFIPYPIHSFFIEGRNISGITANLSISIQIYYGLWGFSDNRDFRIKLLSIPEEMYRFEKNLYTYERNHDDPFSEPFYLKGNIEGGHGIFAICRSSDIFITAIHGYH